MERIYKRCPSCGEHIYREEVRCRYCRQRVEIEGGYYGGGRSGDDNYRDDNYSDELYDDDGYRDNYSRGGDACRPKEPWGNGRSLSGVEIGAILVIAALAGVLFYLLISN